MNPITIPLPQESDLPSSHLPNLLPLTPILNTSGYTRHAILKPVGQALQAITYSFGAGGVVDGLPDATTSCADYATSCARDAADCCSELGLKSTTDLCFFKTPIVWLTVPVTEVMAPVTPLLLSGMLVLVKRIRLLYRVVRWNLVA